MKVLDLFSGIGGFSLGLERAGMETVAFCEIDKHCQAVLRKHWPYTVIFDDVKEVNGKMMVDFGIDLICGGYPCVGHSVAGKKEGFKNENSALWREYLRIVGEIKPRYCIIENSPNLRNTGLVEILKAFNEVGYNAEWSVISAYSIGAPHQRERLYIVLWRKDLSYPNPFRFWETYIEKEKAKSFWWAKRLFKRPSLFTTLSKIKSTICVSNDGLSKELLRYEENKIKMLGNSVVPFIPELIGNMIMEYEGEL